MRTTMIAQVVAAFALLTLAGRARAEEPLSFVTSGELVISKVTDTNEYLAYSKHSGTWKRHTFAEGVKASPVLSGSLCVFAQSGDGITELVGVDRLGNWRTVKLPSPVTECKATISDTVAVFDQNGRTFAFSALTGTWDSVPTVAQHFLEPDMVLMKSDDSIAIFSAQTGVWAKTSLKSEAE